jgi:hypothetical protein
MKITELKQYISELNGQALCADGFDDALIGHVTIFNKTLALYDSEKCIKVLMKRDGMTREEAEEFFSYNVTGSYMGEGTPAFATLIKVDPRVRPKNSK